MRGRSSPTAPWRSFLESPVRRKFGTWRPTAPGRRRQLPDRCPRHSWCLGRFTRSTCKSLEFEKRFYYELLGMLARSRFLWLLHVKSAFHERTVFPGQWQEGPAGAGGSGGLLADHGKSACAAVRRTVVSGRATRQSAR